MLRIILFQINDPTMICLKNILSRKKRARCINILFYKRLQEVLASGSAHFFLKKLWTPKGLKTKTYIFVSGVLKQKCRNHQNEYIFSILFRTVISFRNLFLQITIQITSVRCNFKTCQIKRFSLLKWRMNWQTSKGKLLHLKCSFSIVRMQLPICLTDVCTTSV